MKLPSPSATVRPHGRRAFPPRHSRPAAGARRAAVAGHGAIPGDQDRQSGQSAVLPDGRFLRAVLRGCRDREPRARHRAHQARQASRPRHSDVRRAGSPFRRIPAPPDRAGPSRRRMRAARGSRGGEEARLQERGAARRDPPGDARHAHRRHAARCQAQQLPGGARARAGIGGGRGEPFCTGLDRHLHRRVPYRRMRSFRSAGGDRTAGGLRDHRLRRAVVRPRACSVSAHAARGGAGDARRVRRRHRRAAAVGLFRGGDQRGVRRADAAGACRGGGLRHLCRAHAARQTAAAVAAGAGGAGRDAVDRPGDARQPRAHPHARRRATRLPPCRHRPHRDGGWLTAAGAAARRAADRSDEDRATARHRRGVCRGRGRAAGDPRAAQRRARHGARAVASRGRPRRPARPRRGS